MDDRYTKNRPGIAKHKKAIARRLPNSDELARTINPDDGVEAPEIIELEAGDPQSMMGVDVFRIMLQVYQIMVTAIGEPAARDLITASNYLRILFLSALDILPGWVEADRRTTRRRFDMVDMSQTGEQYVSGLMTALVGIDLMPLSIIRDMIDHPEFLTILFRDGWRQMERLYIDCDQPLSAKPGMMPRKWARRGPIIWDSSSITILEPLDNIVRNGFVDSVEFLKSVDGQPWAPTNIMEHLLARQWKAPDDKLIPEHWDKCRVVFPDRFVHSHYPWDVVLEMHQLPNGRWDWGFCKELENLRRNTVIAMMNTNYDQVGTLARILAPAFNLGGKK